MWVLEIGRRSSLPELILMATSGNTLFDQTKTLLWDREKCYETRRRKKKYYEKEKNDQIFKVEIK